SSSNHASLMVMGDLLLGLSQSYDESRTDQGCSADRRVDGHRKPARRGRARPRGPGLGSPGRTDHEPWSQRGDTTEVALSCSTRNRNGTSSASSPMTRCTCSSASSEALTSKVYSAVPSSVR